MPPTTAPLVPKNPGSELQVVAIGRISTIHQDVENIEASYRYIQDYLGRIYRGPMNIRLLGEQASGMLTDRATIREAEDLVAGGKVDLVIAEDLARIYRNPRYQYDFVQNAVDIGTRVICIGDNLDTADENWEITMGAAALRHGLHIPDTRRRVRRTATHSFHKGGMVQKIRYGYRKLTPDEAASGHFGPKDLRIAKQTECTPVIREMSQRVLRGETYAAVADWLESEGVSPGPYVLSRRWSPRIVVELLDDPILSGTRTFRDTICRPVFKTGKHKPERNSEPETEHCPDLAHITAEEHELLKAEIARRRADRKRSRSSAARRNVPRSRTFWPGQTATCGICGGPMYYSGSYLRCRNSLPRYGASCWNHVQVPVELARQRMVSWLVAHLERTPDLQSAMAAMVRRILEGTGGRHGRRQHDVAREVQTLERQAANLAAAIADGGQLQALVQKLKATEAALERARASQRKLQCHDQEKSQAKDDVERDLPATLLNLASHSFEFADQLRRIFPSFFIQPVQQLDCGQMRPRGRLRCSPGAIEAGRSGQSDAPTAVDDVVLELDLFEPPSFILHLPACLAAKEAHPQLSLKGIAASLGINHMTVKRAFDYARLMTRMAVSVPYREISSCPAEASRWRQRRTGQPRRRVATASSAVDAS